MIAGTNALIFKLGQGTTAGGPNWIADLTVKYNQSLVLNYNLAVGGAVIDNNIVANPGYPSDLVSQVALFKQTYSRKPASAPWTAASSVFGIWIGINESGAPCSFHPTFFSFYIRTDKLTRRV